MAKCKALTGSAVKGLGATAFERVQKTQDAKGVRNWKEILRKRYKRDLDEKEIYEILGNRPIKQKEKQNVSDVWVWDHKRNALWANGGGSNGPLNILNSGTNNELSLNFWEPLPCEFLENALTVQHIQHHWLKLSNQGHLSGPLWQPVFPKSLINR